jgi:hypothetical protein
LRRCIDAYSITADVEIARLVENQCAACAVADDFDVLRAAGRVDQEIGIAAGGIEIAEAISDNGSDALTIKGALELQCARVEGIDRRAADRAIRLAEIATRVES